VEKLKKYLARFCFLGLLVLSESLSSYVHTVSSTGVKVFWPKFDSDVVEVFVNFSNDSGYNESTLEAIANLSVSEWNNHSKLKIQLGRTAGSNQDGLNEIFFSNDPNFFSGTGVVAVTQVAYKEDDGVILEADIAINSDVVLSTNASSTNYLGNVLSHELGHFLGLAHSQVFSSTMFYQMAKGQYKLDADDKAGVHSIYPIDQSTKSSINGKIFGGANVLGIYGATVQALSKKDGEVKASAMSQSDGGFSIQGLNQNDDYYLFVQPTVTSVLPSFYSKAQNNFCQNSLSYRGSFYQTCRRSEEGYPQAVRVNTSNVDVGNITIRCSLDSPPDYLMAKNTQQNFDLPIVVGEKIGNAFVGFFSSQELMANSVDKVTIDLSSKNQSYFDGLSTKPLYLELRVLNQKFNSMFKANVSVKQGSQEYAPASKSSLLSDGSVNIETTLYVPINKSLASENVFEVSIRPEDLSSGNFPSDMTYTRSEIFPAYLTYKDPLAFYFFQAQLVELLSDGSYAIVAAKTYQNADNLTCPDAPNTYEINKNISSNNSSSSGKGGLMCGSIAYVSDQKNIRKDFPLQFAMGFFFVLVFKFLHAIRLIYLRKSHI